MRICQSLANKVWNYNNQPNGHQYDTCGMIIPSLPCAAGLFGCACGGNLMIPSATYNSVEEFIVPTALAPPESPYADDGVSFVIVPDADGNCYGGSGAAGLATSALTWAAVVLSSVILAVLT